jgi:hypothetical protein
VAFPFLLGADPSPHDPSDFAFADSELLAGALPSTNASPSILDAHEYRTQRYQDCIAFACIEPVQALFKVLGRPKPKLAPLFQYGGSRLLAAPPKPGARLVDTGCSYRYALKWGRDEGYVAESLWPETDENVVVTPPADVRQAARSAKMVAAHRIIAPTLEDFRVQLRASLALARDGKATSPGFVMPVHEGYIAAGSSVYTAPAGKLLGYHGQPIMGMDGPADVALVPGSWGPEAGDRGLFRISIPCLYQIGSEFWIQEINPNAFEVTE